MLVVSASVLIVVVLSVLACVVVCSLSEGPATTVVSISSHRLDAVAVVLVLVLLLAIGLSVFGDAS